MTGKIKSLGELEQIVGGLKEQGKRIVHCHGVFDMMHPGHIKSLQAAKREGDVLVVTVTEDKYVDKGPDRPYYTHNIRAETLASLECVDLVAINNVSTAVGLIESLKPDVYVKGSEFKGGNDATGKIQKEIEAIEKVGGRIFYTDEITFSSSKIINAHSDLYPKETREYLKKLSSQHSSKEIIKSLKDLGKLKVLVIGDTIIDEYHYVQPLERPPKETMLAVKYIGEETFAGATLASANHVAGFCKNIDLVTCLGENDWEKQERFIREHLKSNISPTFFYRKDAPTTIKRRYVEKPFLRKLFEVCVVDENQLNNELEENVVNHLNQMLPEYDAVIVSDFGHGFIGNKMIDCLSEKSKFLAVSTQTNESNNGFNMITKYPRADYICIDEPEVRLAMHEKNAPIRSLIEKLISERDYKNVIITQGHKGSLAYSAKEGFSEIPVFSSGSVVDTIGAGDAYFSVTSPYIANGNSMELAGFIGNVAGAIAVNYIGNKESVEPDKVYKFINTLMK
ncbi:MAG: PfkB family carbohydrate kinase [Candidatus Pacearchaeota archaeon]|jgi:rfaE bifunctional protein nucleotidyltransferase chain/domain